MDIFILTGSGISAESGIGTFRDPGGLWENHDPRQLATPEAFARDPILVHRFYNWRRETCHKAGPAAKDFSLPPHKASGKSILLHRSTICDFACAIAEN